MSTEKLYYSGQKLFEFDAEVVCQGQGYVILDRTAFFPEGGGQSSDTGLIGDAKVLDVQEIDGEIRHYVDKIPDGNHCIVDAESRLRKMQMHTGEHILCAIAHNLYGVDNAGFHLGDVVTMDLTGEVDVDKIEKMANEVIRQNLPVITYFPENLDFEYRSKLELTENVRIVEIVGLDKCACCAPHVSSTGEVGMIKVISSVRHRGGVRIEMVSGMTAFDYVCALQNQNDSISKTLSSKRMETYEAVEKLKSEKERAEYLMKGLELKLVADMELKEPVMFASLSPDAQRELCNRLVEKFSTAAVFCDGKYVIGSKTVDLKEKAGAINELISGRGGGKSTMIMGSYNERDDVIKNLIKIENSELLI